MGGLLKKSIQVRDRIKELRRVRASELLPNPRNWRRHPQQQADALRGLLSEVGYADALLVRETSDGLMLIDGHLRAATTPDAKVPVLVLDVTEGEADKLLATLDPLAAMAEQDDEVVAELVGSITTDNDAVRQMLNTAASGVPAFEPVSVETQARLDEKTKVKCPECGAEFVPART